jgi:RNA polymerase sigma factor (sigma-70 family)
LDEQATQPEQRANGPNGCDRIPEVSPKPRADLVALDDVRKRLAAVDERKSRVVELSYFGGLSVEETGEVLKVSPETVMRDWELAKAWLLRKLRGEGHDDA